MQLLHQGPFDSIMEIIPVIYRPICGPTGIKAPKHSYFCECQPNRPNLRVDYHLCKIYFVQPMDKIPAYSKVLAKPTQSWP